MDKKHDHVTRTRTRTDPSQPASQPREPQSESPREKHTRKLLGRWITTQHDGTRDNNHVLYYCMYEKGRGGRGSKPFRAACKRCPAYLLSLSISLPGSHFPLFLCVCLSPLLHRISLSVCLPLSLCVYPTSTSKTMASQTPFLADAQVSDASFDRPCTRHTYHACKKI